MAHDDPSTAGLPMDHQAYDYDAAIVAEFQTAMHAWIAMPEHENRKVIAIDDDNLQKIVPWACGEEATFKKARTKQGAVLELVSFLYTVDITPWKWEKVFLPWGFFNDTRGNTLEAPPPPQPSFKATRLPVSLMIHEDMVDLINAVDEKLLAMSSFDGDSLLSVQEVGDKFIMDAHMVFTGANQTYMSIASDDGQITGCGWDVIEPFMYPYQNLRNSKSKLSISPARIWTEGNKKGVTWQMDCILLIPGPERKEEWEDPLMFTD